MHQPGIRKAIESVSVFFHEKIGIEGRGHFYDRYGAIKDVVQNHVLQILGSYALGAYAVKNKSEERAQKATFFDSLSVSALRRGQYKGYRSEKDVMPESTTETFVAATLESSDSHWKGVPFFLEAGKALAEKSTRLVVKLKPAAGSHETSEVIFHFSPQERIVLPVHMSGEYYHVRNACACLS